MVNYPRIFTSSSEFRVALTSSHNINPLCCPTGGTVCFKQLPNDRTHNADQISVSNIPSNIKADMLIYPFIGIYGIVFKCA